MFFKRQACWILEHFNKNPEKCDYEPIGQNSELAGTGARGQMVRRHAGKELRRLLADAGAAL